MSHYRFAFSLIAYQYALLLTPTCGKRELNRLLGTLFFWIFPLASAFKFANQPSVLFSTIPVYNFVHKL